MKRAAREDRPAIPEGEQVLRIRGVEEPDGRRLVVVWETAGGAALREHFVFRREDGTDNQVADMIFTRLGRAALGDQTLDEIDSDALPGRYVRVEVVYERRAGGLFAAVKRHLGPAEGFGEAPATPRPTAAQLLAEAKARAARR